MVDLLVLFKSVPRSKPRKVVKPVSLLFAFFCFFFAFFCFLQPNLFSSSKKNSKQEKIKKLGAKLFSLNRMLHIKMFPLSEKFSSIFFFFLLFYPWSHLEDFLLLNLRIQASQPILVRGLRQDLNFFLPQNVKVSVAQLVE